MKRMYSVSYPVIYSVEVMAESPAEAAELAAIKAPGDIDGFAMVSRCVNGFGASRYWDEEMGELPKIDPEDEDE